MILRWFWLSIGGSSKYALNDDWAVNCAMWIFGEERIIILIIDLIIISNINIFKWINRRYRWITVRGFINGAGLDICFGLVHFRRSTAISRMISMFKTVKF